MTQGGWTHGQEENGEGDAIGCQGEAGDAHAEQLTSGGSMVMAYALTPRGMATSIRADAITDGPFIDSKEVVAGFYVIEAPDLDAAIAIARTNPVVRDGGGVEIRPVHSGGFVQRDSGPAQAGG